MPTPYETLCKKYKDERDLYFSNQRECGAFVARLHHDLCEYLGGIPDEKIKLYPPDAPDSELTNPRTQFTPLGAIKLMGDSFWHFRICILVEIAPSTWPKARLGVKTRVRAIGDHVIVKLDGAGKSFFRFRRKHPETWNLSQLCNRITQGLSHLLDGTEKFLEQGKEEYENFSLTSHGKP